EGRRAPGRLPGQPVAAPHRTWILAGALRPAHVAARDRQLPRTHARDGEPRVLALPARGPDPRRAQGGGAEKPGKAARNGGRGRAAGRLIRSRRRLKVAAPLSGFVEW